MSILNVIRFAMAGEYTPPEPPPDPLAVPTGLTATDQSTCSTCSGSYSVKLDWSYGDINLFTNVYRNGNYVQQLGQGVVTWTDTGGSLGSEVTYVLRHTDLTYNSDPSSPAYVTPDPCLDDLETPTSAGLVVVGHNQINVTPTGGGTDCTKYNIYTAGGSLLQQVSKGATYNHTSLTENTQYCYDIEAESDTGCKSSKLTSQCETTEYAPLAAPTITVSAESHQRIRVTINSSPNADRWRIYEAGTTNLLGSIFSPDTYLDLTGLDPLTLYEVDVVAQDSTGTRQDSSATSDEATTLDGIPTSFQATQDTSVCPATVRVNLAWDVGTNDVSTIKVSRKEPGEGSYTVLAASLDAGTESYQDNAADGSGSGTTYYRVEFNPESTEEITPAEDSLTVSCLPNAPIGVAVDDDTGGYNVQVTWNDNSSIETGFRVYKATDDGGVPGTWSLEATVGENVEIWRGNQINGTTIHYAVAAYNTNGESARVEAMGNPFTP